MFHVITFYNLIDFLQFSRYLPKILLLFIKIHHGNRKLKYVTILYNKRILYYYINT